MCAPVYLDSVETSVSWILMNVILTLVEMEPRVSMVLIRLGASAFQVTLVHSVNKTLRLVTTAGTNSKDSATSTLLTAAPGMLQKGSVVCRVPTLQASCRTRNKCL